MSRYITIGSELIEIFPTPSGLHSFIPNIGVMDQSQKLSEEIVKRLDQITVQNKSIIELLEQIEINTRKGKPPKDK